jgi:hypothetical protein
VLHDASTFRSGFSVGSTPIGGKVTAPAGDPEPTPTVPKPGPQGGQQPEPEKTFTQAQLNAFIAQTRRETEAKFEGFDEIKAKATQLDQLTESTKSEVQRANESAAEFKARAETEAKEKAEAKLENLRYKLSAKKGLDPELWDRVTGTTEEEITADVEKLAAKFSTQPERRPIGALRSGASAPSNSDPKERAAAALRSQWQQR